MHVRRRVRLLLSLSLSLFSYEKNAKRIFNIIGASILCTRRPLETAKCHPSQPCSSHRLGRSSESHANAIINIVRETALATYLRNSESSISDSINLAAISGKEMLKVGSSRRTVDFFYSGKNALLFEIPFCVSAS